MAEEIFEMHAKTLYGLEPVLAKELAALGAQDIRPGKRLVSFSGDLSLMYRANLHLRTALRILIPLRSFRASNDADLYRGVQRINWSRHMRVSQTLAVDSVVRSPIFRHSHYAALKAKDAIVDQFRQKKGSRPSVDLRRPHLRVHLHIDRDQVDISLDSSGDSLHKRGYRLSGHMAPLNEVLAAGMVLMSEWDINTPFVDPMCGSGTLPIEAAWLAMNRPPGLERKQFGFMRWPNFDRELWRDIRREARAALRPLPSTIVAADNDPNAISLTQRHLEEVGLTGQIDLRKRAFAHLIPPDGPGTLVMNPPYDERIELEDAAVFYKEIGDRLKAVYKGYRAWVLSGHTDALKRLGLKPDFKMQLLNGAIRCKYHRYDVY